MNFSKHLLLAIKASILSGKEIMDIYNSENFEVEIKKDSSPLTKADKLSHKIIVDTLDSTSLPILSEEGNIHPFELRRSWESFWMIDPIDGTKEFIKRNGEFTVNVALIQKNIPILGVVYVPAINHLYFAESGLGAFKIENISEFDQLLNLHHIDLSKSSQYLPNNYTVVVSKSHMNKETQDYINKMKTKYGSLVTKSFGSSLKICKVAEGNAHCYPRFGPTMEWDIAAAHVVAVNAGCKIFTLPTHENFSFNKENLLNPFFIVNREMR